MKLFGLEKLKQNADKEISATFSSKSGLFNDILFITDLEGNYLNSNQTGKRFDIRAGLGRFTTSYQVVTSLDKINSDDMVIILANHKLRHTTKSGRNPPAYAAGLDGHAMVINISDKDYNPRIRKIDGSYDFSTGGKGVQLLAGTIAHELGHLLGLSDKYVEGKNQPPTVIEGFEYNRMGNSYYSSINQDQASTVLLSLLRRLEYQMLIKNGQLDEGQSSENKSVNSILNKEKKIKVPKL